MLKRLKKFIRDKQLFEANDRILLAVSGGMDSVCMAYLFHQAGYHFGIAHCNFQLRGNDSYLDEQFVRTLARSYNVPFYSQPFNTTEEAEKRGISIQMAARDLRYNWFTKILTNEQYDYLATAHHLDDEVETFFINLLRNSGISGFHGILPKHGNLIRPMLFTRREEIDGFVRDQAIPFREDKSNRETKYLRNYIRHKIVPGLTSVQADFPILMNENIRHIREAEMIFREALEKKRNELLSINKGTVTISIDAIERLSPMETYLYEFLSPYGFNETQVNDLIGTLDKISGKSLLSSTHRLVKDRKEIFIVEKQRTVTGKETIREYRVKSSSTRIRKPVPLSFSRVTWTHQFPIDPSPSVAHLDTKKLVFPLLIRRWKHGDTFYPFGRSQRKKLSDYFTDNKFSLLEKEEVWVLCSGTNIVWVIGHRIDHRYRITSHTKEILVIRSSKNMQFND
jgi:tRNA(Ile)-lysidine synthase